MRFLKWGATALILTSKLHVFLKCLSSMLMDFHETSVTGILLIETIKMRGNKPMLTSKLHVLLKFLGSLLMDFRETVFYNRDSFDETIKMRNNNPMITPKLHDFV